LTSAVRIAVQVALVALFSYLGGFQFTSLFHGASAGMGALWSTISAILVLQATRGGTWSSAGIRVLGTLVGSIVSAAYLSWLTFSALGLAASIFVTVLICHAARIPDHARLAALTVAVVMVLSTLNPTLTPILSATLRFGESCVGTAVALLVALSWPEPAPPPVR
jgi:uncharacterized membrane protein YgaE (UPF0421/DUF939 family)